MNAYERGQWLDVVPVPRIGAPRHHTVDRPNRRGATTCSGQQIYVLNGPKNRAATEGFGLPVLSGKGTASWWLALTVVVVRRVEDISEADPDTLVSERNH